MAEQQTPSAASGSSSIAGGRLGSTALAVVVHIAIVGAAVETFRSQAPVRWWVVTVVAAYLAGLVGGWRLVPGLRARLTSATLAAIGSGLFLALLAVTAWLPGGSVAGIRLFGQPTAALLAAVSAAVVALAGASLVRQRLLPSWARYLLGILAAYGVVSFSLGIADGTPFASLLQGASFWARWPRWLQGTFVGGFVILPAGILVGVAGLVRRRAPGTGGTWRVTHVALLGLGLAITASGLRAPVPNGLPGEGPTVGSEPRLADGALPSSQPTPPAGPAPVVTLAKGETAQMFKAFQDVPRAVDRTTFDVSARAAALGPDTTTTFAFVRDQIANEIYPGVLRGAAGTLSAGAGNDLDKSVLLGALLAEAKHVVRYARCTLAPDEAQRRVAAMFTDRAVPLRESDVTPVLESALVRAGVSAARSTEIVNARGGLRTWLNRAIFERARADLGIVRGALDRKGLRPLTGSPDPTVVEEARAHYWVQVDRGGSWEDLDASVAGARPGTTPCVAAETYPELPLQVFQTMTVSVRNEYLEDQALRSENVLSHQFKVSDLYGRVITFVNVGSSAPKGLMSGSKTERLIPFLSTGEQIFPGKEYATSPASAPASADMLSAGLSGASDGPALVAQWLDFVLEAPGRRSLVSRAVADLVDLRERASGKVLTRPDPAVLEAQLAQSCAIAVSAGFIQPAAAIETAFAQLDAQAAGRSFDGPARPDRSDQSALDDRALTSDPLLAAYALAYASVSERALTGLSRTGDPHVRLIRDQPMVTIANIAVRPVGDGKGWVAELSVDLRHNAVRVVVESPAYAAQGFWANVLRGLVDGALEHHVPAAAVRAARRPAPLPERFDTSLAFELARAQGIEVRADTGPPATQLLLGPLADSGGRRLASEVGDATAIVVPVRALLFQNERRLGLWTVNMRTGDLLALLDTGLRGGQGTTDRSVLETNVDALEVRVRLCVSLNPNIENCRRLFQLWGRAANALLENVGETVRLGITEGGDLSYLL